jgi:hypothetical protein
MSMILVKMVKGKAHMCRNLWFPKPEHGGGYETAEKGWWKTKGHRIYEGRRGIRYMKDEGASDI